MRKLLRFNIQQAYLLEAALIGVFFVSALRFLVGMVYSRMGGVSITVALDPASIPANVPGAVSPSLVTNELMFLVYVLALPLLTLVLGRFRWLMVVGAVLVALGRVLMLSDSSVTPLMAAAMAVGGGLIYLSMVVRHRAQMLPYFFVLGLGLDQLIRALGNTLDPTWSANTVVLSVEGSALPYLPVQVALSALVALLTIGTMLAQRRALRDPASSMSPDYGLLPVWGGMGLGGLLFLHLSLLSLPNAIAGRAGIDYTNFAPFVTLATLLPLIPWVQTQARLFTTWFEGSARGGTWMLLLALLVIFGTRFQGPAAGIALVVATFVASMLWWWLVRPQAEKERNISGLWIVLAMLVFALLAVGDNFTYEYAFVRGFAPELAFLNDILPPLLRGFRSMGLGIILLSIFLAALPMIQTQRRIPWGSGPLRQPLPMLLLVIVLSAGVAAAVRPAVIAGVRNVSQLRIGTYNIHGGFNEFYAFELTGMADTIRDSGANAVLLQQVEAGRLTSFGVDQALWLARRLNMAPRFFPTNEGLQGLAVLSNVEIVFDDGVLLNSVGHQTGLQRVQIRPDAGVITLYNTWLGFLLEVDDGRTLEQQEQDQQRQLNEVFVIISSHHPDGNLGRIIIGGTFNNIPDSPLGDQMRAAGFNDPFAGLPPELTATLWRTGLPRVRLDYIWTRPPLLPVGALVMDSSASDHRMAVIETLIVRGAQ